jgi:competence protein ComEA
MQRISKFVIVALASFGLAFASNAVMAQKAETPKDTSTTTTTTTTKKTETSAKTDAKKADTTKPAETKKTDAKADAKKADAAKPAAGALIDINSASEKELASLKGIGDVRAKAIVKGRPYKGKNELADKKIIPQGVYDEIKDQIIAKQDTAAAAPKKDAKK